jgi:hypothetical protein
MALENQFAGAEAGELKASEHSFWSWVRGRRVPEVTPAPTSPDPLQAAIDAIENQLNKKRGELDELCQQIRPDALQREMATVRAAQRVAIQNFLDDWMPVVREMREEYSRLDEQRRALLAERKARVASIT